MEGVFPSCKCRKGVTKKRVLLSCGILQGWLKTEREEVLCKVSGKRVTSGRLLDISELQQLVSDSSYDQVIMSLGHLISTNFPAVILL